MSVGKAFFNYGAGLGQGFTLVFNRALRDKAFQPGYLDIRGHDVWLWAVISGLRSGYYYDNYSSAAYRRHVDTVTPTGKGNMKLWRWRLQVFLEGDIFERNAKAIHSYNILFGKEITTHEDHIFLSIFGDIRYKGKKRLQKTFYPYRLKESFLEEVVLRFTFLCGKI
jgi:hypothetical protein